MICLKCGNVFESGVPTRLDPSYKSRIMDGSLFLCRCPRCSAPTLAEGPFVYYDESLSVLLVQSAVTLNALECPPGWTCRQVSEVGVFIEKLKIFDAGLDDVAIEICKYVTTRELGGIKDMKFLGINGSDGEITLTYPENGAMQLVTIGANVYSDAVSILRRNPALVPSGLARVDSNYIRQLLQ